MKNTSRRKFGKQLGGALIALPLASHLVEAGEVDQKNRPDKKDRVEIKSEHNTPPPALFMGGSLVFEVFSAKTDWETDGPEVDSRRKWSVKPKPYSNGTQPTNIFIAHVKLIDGAGEKLEQVDNPRKLPIEIVLTLKKNNQAFGDCKWTAVGDHFEIDLPSSKRLKMKANDPPHNPLRQRVRYMNETGNDADQCEWVGLKITRGGSSQFDNQNLPGLPGYDETLRLMVWWENR